MRDERPPDPADGRDGDLRGRFSSPPPGAPVADDCPHSTLIWDAAHGESLPADVGALLDHVAGCAACTVAWRIAREDAVSRADGALRPARPASRPLAHGLLPWMGLAAAAVVILAVAGFVLRPGGPLSRLSATPPPMRSPSDREIRTLVDEGARLPRTACDLRWTSAGEGARYRIEVTDERLELLAESHGLESPEYHVSESALAALPRGSRILWRVQAERPDGWKGTSPTFAARVE